MAQQIQLRRGTAAQWTSANPTLAIGEMGLETDTQKYKIGTGSANWNTLPYAVNFVTGATGSTGPVGSTGATGVPFPYTALSDNVPPYFYSGKAFTGTATSSPTWSVKRIQSNSKGDVVASLGATGAWDNRYTLPYA